MSDTWYIMVLNMNTVRRPKGLNLCVYWVISIDIDLLLIIIGFSMVDYFFIISAVMIYYWLLLFSIFYCYLQK